MKNIKKIMGFLLVCVLSLTLVTTVFAEEPEVPEKGKITIDNAVSGETYKLYKIFELESYDKTKGTYAYKALPAWEDFFKTGGAGHNYVDIDEAGYVTANTLDDTTVEAFAKLALTYAQSHAATAIDTKVASSATVIFENLDLGYYLVDTTLGTLCSIDTTDNEVTIKEKNTIPTIVNEVKEGTTYGPTNDLFIGDTVNYKETINAYKGAENYVVHVKLDSGLTYNGSVVVKDVTDSSDVKTLTLGTDYTVVTTGLSDNETVNIVFTKTYLDSITGTSTVPTKIEVTYNATLNENAVIAGNGNQSTVKLTYGENNESTVSDVTKTYTWKNNYFKFYKETPDATEEEPLADAKFVLSTSTNTSDAIAFVKTGNTYRKAVSGETGTITEIVTDSTGLFEVTGLDSGTYYLIETKAPEGYNKLKNPVTVVVENVTDTTAETMTYQIKVGGNVVTGNIKVENKSGTILPSTGGMGTKLFIMIGTMLFLSTAVVLVTKKRMYNAS